MVSFGNTLKWKLVSGNFVRKDDGLRGRSWGVGDGVGEETLICDRAADEDPVASTEMWSWDGQSEPSWRKAREP